MDLKRIKNKLIAKLLTRFPSLSKKFTDSYEAQSSQDIPWTPTTKPLSDATIAIVTTAGVHHKDQTPFDMKDQDGDPSFREIDITKPLNDLMITHDYYDHADADKDINIVFPVERLIEFAQEKIIGSVAKIHYGFMGHILGRHIPTLVHTVAPQVAKKLKDAHVDIVLLVPG